MFDNSPSRKSFPDLRSTYYQFSLSYFTSILFCFFMYIGMTGCLWYRILSKYYQPLTCIFSFCFPRSTLRAVQAPGHRAETAALWGSQHHGGLCVYGPRVALPRNRCSVEQHQPRYQPRRGHSGKHRFWQDGHHLPSGGSQLPRQPHEADRLGQPAGFTQT